MTVESSHLNPFPPQFVQDREIWMNFCNEGQGMDVYKHEHEHEQMRFPATLPGNQWSFYQQPKTSINSESGLACNINPSSRKRVRDSGDELYGGMPSSSSLQKRNVYGCQSLGENIRQPQMQPYYQLEMDAIICEHTKRMRLELQQRQKQNAKVLVAAMGEWMIKRVRDKEDEKEKMVRWNAMLEEKVKGLYIENNLWRELAQRNEATANSLQQALHHAQYPTPTEESCGSSNDDDDDDEYDKKEKENRSLMCRKCGEGRCSVVLLPCRHLCLCGLCSSSSSSSSSPNPIHSCPLCYSTITATLHLNMS